MYLFIDKPRVSLRLGKSLDPDNLRTGNDVYFECDVKSNPMPHKLIWLHRVSQVTKLSPPPMYSLQGFLLRLGIIILSDTFIGGYIMLGTYSQPPANNSPLISIAML